MRLLNFDEYTLTRLLVEAKQHLFVSNDSDKFIIPLREKIPMSARHFVATNIETNENTVLQYNQIKRVSIDFTVFCLQ